MTKQQLIKQLENGYHLEDKDLQELSEYIAMLTKLLNDRK